MTDIKLIKSRINCITLAKHLNLSISKDGDRCVSPRGGTNRTEFAVYTDRFIDFKYNISGDVIDLLAYVKFNDDKSQAIRYLADMTGVSSNTSSNWRNSVQNQCNLTQKWHESLSQSHTDYLHSRLIADSTINFFKIGYSNNRIIVPYFKNGYVCNWVGRTLSPVTPENPKYLKPTQNPETATKLNLSIDWIDPSAPFGLNTLSPDKPIVISEGTFDALSFYQSGYSVLSSMGGFFSQSQSKTLLSVLKSTSNKIYVCFDNDTAGSLFALQLSKYLFQHRITHSILSIPQPFKDASEYYTARSTLSDLPSIPDTRFLAQNITNTDDFQQFMYTCSRYVTKPNLALIFDCSPLPVAFLKELKKTVSSAPPELTIVNDVLSKHQLLYHPAIGFLKYTNTHWQTVPDDKIKSFISDELGIYTTGSKLNSILTVIRSKTISMELFNKKPLMNFINGTLNLSSEPTLQPHNPDDLLTYCLDYPYNPNLKSPEWENFINDITNSDPLSQAALQEWAGYPLFPTNSLQKCCCLIGAGANGKSVFLDILSLLYGKENVSHIEMSALGQQFQAIHLMNSLLNISSETKSEMALSESVFKQIVAGDSISSCFKSKDMISFVPRSKLFVACNDFVKSHDTTEGFMRRWSFIRFPMHFVERPDTNNPLEKSININISSRFTTPQQLSAIFNWALKGYLYLKQNQHFTDTREQNVFIREFKENSNPIVVFANDYEIPTDVTFLTTKNFYDIYRNWCDDTGNKPTSMNAFSKEIRNLRTDILPVRTNTLRGFSVTRKEPENHVVTKIADWIFEEPVISGQI